MTTKIIDGEVMFVEDISRLFKISPTTIRRKGWREKTGIPLRKVGKRLCGMRVEIENWFKGLNG